MKKLVFISLLLLGFLLRIVRIDSRPLGFTWDEAALGYNAYSLLLTGRDEYGDLFPVVFKSFGDYKPGLYIYFTVPAVKLFGLTEFATRLPSAIFGTLLLAVIFVLSKLIFPKKESIGYWTLGIAATNPWLIHFSRGGWEANLNLLLISLAAALFIKKRYVSAGLCFGLTFLAYQSAKLFTPLLLISLVFIYRQSLSFKKMFLPFVLFSVFLIPISLNFASQSGRLRVFSVFSYFRQPADVAEILNQDQAISKDITYYLFHSELLDQGRGVLQRYLTHLSPRFLFSEGDWTNLRHSLYKHGNFYLIEIVPLAIGLFIFLSGLKAKSYRLLASWLLLAPLPAAFSRDLVSAVRSLPLAIPLILITGLGLSHIVKSKIMITVYCLLFTFFIVYYLDLYYIHGPHYSAPDWVSVYKKAYQDIADNLTDYSKFIVTDKLGQPYIFALFYLKIDPSIYQEQAKLTASETGDVGRVESFQNFIFRPVFWPELRGLTSTLFIGDQYELPEKDLNITGLTRLDDIYYPNGQHALRVVAIP